MALLEVHGLVKQYGRRVVVDGVDLEVNENEIVGLLGPNGAGKTTTFRMTAGMISPLSGTVCFNGIDVTDMPMYQRARHGLGYLAQDSSVFRKLSVEDNLYAILELMKYRRGQPHRFSRKERRKRVDELLNQFGLTKLRRNTSVTLSGGERRRLEIARCLITDPMLIMLDEPFTGIDPKTVGDIQQIVTGLRDEGIAVLITDHHVAETLRITDRSYLIADGKMLSHGTPQEIVNDPRARKVYLGENFIAASIGDQVAQPKDGAIRSLLDREQVIDLVNQLAGDSYLQAAEQLRLRTQFAVPALTEALQRSDTVLRRRAHQLLCELTGVELHFDANANFLSRRRQLKEIHQTLSRRRAG